jgi:hypothetical protein
LKEKLGTDNRDASDKFTITAPGPLEQGVAGSP